jgi:hypothetical protein
VTKHSSILALDDRKIEADAIRHAAMRAITDVLLCDTNFQERTHLAKISICLDLVFLKDLLTISKLCKLFGSKFMLQKKIDTAVIFELMYSYI